MEIAVIHTHALMINSSLKSKATTLALIVVKKVMPIAATRIVVSDDIMVEPDWVSLNLVVLLCIECSGIHRSLGAHISKMRSLSLDTLEEDLLEVFEKTGNAAANNIWEELAADRKPTPDAQRIEKERWIRKKYVNRDFVGPDIDTKTQNTTPLVLAVLRAIARGTESEILEVRRRAQREHNAAALRLLALNGMEDSLESGEEPQWDAESSDGLADKRLRLPKDQEDNNAMLDEFVTVKYRFMGTEDEDLPIIAPGDRIKVVSKDESGWWRGELQGKVGLFPANYTSAEIV